MPEIRMPPRTPQGLQATLQGLRRTMSLTAFSEAASSGRGYKSRFNLFKLPSKWGFGVFDFQFRESRFQAADDPGRT
jgi:hypothetical protein